MANTMNELLGNLSDVPSIIGALGLNISEAQKAFNLDYLNNIQQILQLVMKNSKDKKVKTEDFESLFKGIILQLAPPRYQFTETTLTVRLDLAQTTDTNVAGGFNAGIGAVAINAAMSVGYGNDYRGAAEIKTVIHAIPSDTALLKDLLDQAAKLTAKDTALPAESKVDQAIVDQTTSLLNLMSGQKAEDAE